MDKGNKFGSDGKRSVNISPEARGLLYTLMEMIINAECINTKEVEANNHDFFVFALDMHLSKTRWMTLLWFDQSENEILSATVTNDIPGLTGHSIVRVENNPIEFTIVKSVDEFMHPF